MKHICFCGEWLNSTELISLLQQAGNLVSLAVPNTTIPTADLLMLRLADATLLAQIDQSSIPWIAWTCANSEPITTLAYQAGAQAVFPDKTPPSVILLFVQRFLETHTSEPSTSPLEKAILRRYQKGDTILLDAGSVLEVQQGIIAQTMVYQDGTEVLLGLIGPHSLAVPHPEDTCYIQLVAHTNTSLIIQPWGTAVLSPIFPEKLRSRLQQMEGWAAMQARPHLDQRVLGILSLLAEQFGEESPSGEIVTVRITHMQLASAVGATRTTITRTLGDLKNQGRVTLLQTEDGERFCLPKWEPGHHGLHGNC